MLTVNGGLVGLGRVGLEARPGLFRGRGGGARMMMERLRWWSCVGNNATWFWPSLRDLGVLTSLQRLAHTGQEQAGPRADELQECAGWLGAWLAGNGWPRAAAAHAQNKQRLAMKMHALGSFPALAWGSKTERTSLPPPAPCSGVPDGLVVAGQGQSGVQRAFCCQKLACVLSSSSPQRRAMIMLSNARIHSHTQPQNTSYTSTDRKDRQRKPCLTGGICRSGTLW